MGTIANGKNTPLNQRQGSIPDVSGGMQDYWQAMTFTPVTKVTRAFQVVETGTPITFRGVIMPLSARRIELKPEGQRAWTWLQLFSDPVLELDVDDVVLYLGKQTRVMATTDYRLYGYVLYELVQDWTNAGPS